LALLYSAPRSASIKAVKLSHLWYIDRATFRNAVSTIIEKKFTENREFIDKNSFFTYLTDVQMDKLASISISQKFEKGSKICKEGELASSIYILKSGKLRKTCEGVKIGDINKGDSFEEYASLKKGSVRRETITVVDDAEVLALGVEDIETVLGRSLPLIILRNHARSALKNSKNFSKLSAENL
jgi:CRP-like cAMP-binding protein